MNRRSFLYYSFATAITTSLRTELMYASNNPDVITIDLDKELTSVGNSKKVEKIIVVRTAEGNRPDSFVALSDICTHKGCKVSYEKDKKLFECPCHKSRYDMDGEVINGPAKKALTRYAVNISENKLVIYSPQN